MLGTTAEMSPKKLESNPGSEPKLKLNKAQESVSIRNMPKLKLEHVIYRIQGLSCSIQTNTLMVLLKF